MTPGSGQPALAATDLARVRSALAGTGLWLDVGAVTLRVRSELPALAAQLQAVYSHFPFIDTADWADLHIDLVRPSGWRRWLRPQVVFSSDGRQPFDPFPADSPLPLLEWGANWLIGRRLNDQLLLHAGVVERDGLALLLPAVPGSGKSTLTAALALRGWRLLSDEFGALDPVDGQLRPVLKPVALKNASIAVIRKWSPQAQLGPEFPKTRKGRVAHLAAPAEAVARRHEQAWPGAVVLPRWQAGSITYWRRIAPEVVFRALAFNAFNYAVLGEAGFNAIVRIARGCPAWELIYGDLSDAIRTLEIAWQEVVATRGNDSASELRGAAVVESRP
jgi:HprK-related kinase A